MEMTNSKISIEMVIEKSYSEKVKLWLKSKENEPAPLRVELKMRKMKNFKSQGFNATVTKWIIGTITKLAGSSRAK